SAWMNRFKPLKWLLDGQQRLMDGLHAAYDAALRWSLRYRKTTLAGAALIFVGSFFLVPFIGSEFVPQDDEGQTNVRIQTPIGSSLTYTLGKAEQVETALREFPEVTQISKSVSKNSAWFDIKLVDRKLRKRSQQAMGDEFRKRLAGIAGLEVNVGWNRPIQLFILGPDIVQLDRISQQAIAKMKAIKGMVDIESSYKPTTPTLDIVVNRELASDLGVSMTQIATTTRALIGGELAGQWQGPDGENHQIRLRLPKDARTGIADLDKLYVASSTPNADGAQQMVPLRQVADFQPAFAERQIDRRSLQRQIRINAGVGKDANVGEVSAEMREALKDIQLPPGYRFQYGGSSQDMQESLKFAIAALALGVIFIYLILASQFGSFLQPLAIMASLPLSLVGVFLALLAFGSTLNLFSVIGFIMLMGLVTKNAILLVDFTNHGIREGLPRNEAILAAGQVRLRPILMTTGAMVGGMLPLALALGAGSEQQSPMAHAVIGGILTSTLLTLVVVPVLYTYFDTWGRWVKARLLRPEVSAQAGGSTEPVLAGRRED
ncbi:MAG: efflux RND transporter permease subunit, partial [Betaproteobacteria bacterium]|nr:efflux RND transporter permease subunit [Betaproteobacteria bacterium]